MGCYPSSGCLQGEIQDVIREESDGVRDGGLFLCEVRVGAERRRVLLDRHAILTGRQVPLAGLLALEASDVGGPRALVGDAVGGLAQDA